MPKELHHPRKGLIKIKNTNDNECFKWCLVRYLHPTDPSPGRIRKVGKLYGHKLDLKNIKFPVTVRDIDKIKRKNSSGISVFMCQKMF